MSDASLIALLLRCALAALVALVLCLPPWWAAGRLRILLRIVARVLGRPGVLRLLASGVAGPRGGGGVDPRAPELTYIAVREEARGAGVGSALLTAFHSALRGQGVGRYELSVEADNQGAVAFYESRGLRPIGTYQQFGATYRRYTLELPPTAGAEAR